MLFNSLDFVLFFITIWAIYNQVKSPAGRQYLLLAASLFFYACWKPEYLVLLLISAGIDYFLALKIEQARSKAIRKGLLFLSVGCNLGILFFFKYCSFFFQNVFQLFRIKDAPPILEVVLPLGISFYTFQIIAYVVDVYRKNQKAESDFGQYLLFISFFPQLVAGPIERAGHLLGQLKNSGPAPQQKWLSAFWLMAIGFWKKLFLADRLGTFVDPVFAAPAEALPAEIALAVVFFGFQIYGDFSGYSDIARGLARLFGIELMLNFKQPYLAYNLQDFWRKWHISLSGWFRDYVYFPLGGNKRGIPALNLLIVFGLSGFWHGANWTFVCWGLWHGLLLGLELQLKRFQIFLPLLRVAMYPAVFYGWLLFRANSLADVSLLTSGLLSMAKDFSMRPAWMYSKSEFALGLLAIFGLMWMEWLWGNGRLVAWQRKLESSWMALLVFAFLLIWTGTFKGQDFIYFQF